MTTDEAAAIAEIHEQDVAEVRTLLRQAIRTAGERWLPMDAIADALARELVILRGHEPRVLQTDTNHTSITVWRTIARRPAGHS